MALYALLLSLLVGCVGNEGVDAGGSVDGGDAGPADGAAVSPPEIPWLEAGEPPVAAPDFTSCPTGWRAVERDSVTVCDPWPEGGIIDCPPSELHLPGEAGCLPIGDPCPAGDYAEDLPVDRPVIYVLAGAAPGGDGTRARPFFGFGIEDPAYTRAPGTAVALGKGTYDLYTTGFTDIEIIGACATETVLASSSTTINHVVLALQGTSSLRNVQVGPAAHMGILVDGDVTMRGVAIEQVRDVGVIVGQSTSPTPGLELHAEEIVIRDVTPSAGRGTAPAMIRGAASDVELRRVEIARASGLGLSFTERAPGRLLLEDVVIRDTAPNLDDDNALGAQVAGPVAVEARRVAFENNLGGGLYLISTEPATLEWVVFRGANHRALTSVFPFSGGGLGLQAAPVTGHHLWFADNQVKEVQSEPLLVANASPATLEDVVFTDNTSGVLVRDASDLRMRRVHFAGQRAADINLAGDGTTVDVEDGRLGAMNPYDVGVTWSGATYLFEIASFGSVMTWGGQPSLTLRRAVIAGAAEMGVSFFSGGTLTMEDVLIDRLATDVWGVGAYLVQADVTMSRVVLRRAATAALYGIQSDLDLDDVFVGDIVGSAVDGRSGNGILLNHSIATANRVRVADTREVGVWLLGSSGFVGEDLVVDRTRFRRCVDEEINRPDPDDVGCEPQGHGVFIVGSAGFDVTRFRFADAALCGLLMAGTPEVDLRDGEVSRSEIGLCVQSEGYDLSRLSGGVRFLENGANLDSTALPLPMPPPELTVPEMVLPEM